MAAELFVEIATRLGLPVALLVVLWRYHVNRQTIVDRLLEKRDEQADRQLAIKEAECAKTIMGKDVEIARLNEERLKMADRHREEAQRLSERYSSEKTRLVAAATEAARELGAMLAIMQERERDDHTR